MAACADHGLRRVALGAHREGGDVDACGRARLDELELDGLGARLAGDVGPGRVGLGAGIVADELDEEAVAAARLELAEDGDAAHGPGRARRVDDLHGRRQGAGVARAVDGPRADRVLALAQGQRGDLEGAVEPGGDRGPRGVAHDDLDREPEGEHADEVLALAAVAVGGQPGVPVGEVAFHPAVGVPFRLPRGPGVVAFGLLRCPQHVPLLGRPTLAELDAEDPEPLTPRRAEHRHMPPRTTSPSRGNETDTGFGAACWPAWASSGARTSASTARRCRSRFSRRGTGAIHRLPMPLPWHVDPLGEKIAPG